jgi:hypothetical protein
MATTADKLKQLQRNILSSPGAPRGARQSPIEINRDVGPTASLDNDPFSFASISYPKDLTQDMQQGHYMLFYINVQNATKYIYDPYEKDSSIGSIQQTFVSTGAAGKGEWSEDFVSSGEVDASYRAELIKKGAKGTIISDIPDLRKARKAMSGFSSVMPTTTRITDSIAIYLPPNVSDDTTIKYQGVDMGAIGMLAVGGANLVDAIQRTDMAAMGSVIGGAAAKAAMVGAKKFSAEAISLFGDIDPDKVIQFGEKAFGRATNPYMEVLFDNVDLRTFDYTFTFSPRNADETNDVQTIIKMFRFHALPEVSGTNQAFMKLPSTFDIHYMYQLDKDIATENSFYTKIATCVCSGVKVNYTPEAVKSFASGAPTQITMTLSFQETEMLTKAHVEAGY